MSTNECWKNSDNWTICCHKFFSAVLISSKVSLFMWLIKVLIICKWNENWQSIDFFKNNFSKFFFRLHHITPKTPVPVVNNPIRSKIPWPNIGYFLRLPGRGLTNRMLMVRVSRVTISCGFKVEFCVEKWFHGVFAWSDYFVDKCTSRITDEMDMTPLQVSCWRGKFLRRTQSDTPSTIIYTW